MINPFGSGDTGLDQAINDLQTAGAATDPTQRAEGVLTSLFTLVPRIYSEIKAWAAAVVTAVTDQAARITNIQQKLDTADQTFTQTKDKISSEVEEINRKLAAGDTSFTDLTNKVKTEMDGIKQGADAL